MDVLEKIDAFLNKIFVIVGGVAVLSLMTLATGNVCLRIFQMPYRGAYEIVSFLGAVVTAFALGYTQKRKSHIVVDILSGTFPDGVKRALDAVSYLLSFVFASIISWVILDWGVRIMRSGELSETLKIIHYPFIFCVAIGFAVYCLTLVNDFLKALLKKGGK